MGLCKCPKKKVTNLFCFEHKVNVCEHCLVSDHEKCVVKSYLQWLEDSDYNSICSICDKELQVDDIECIRLVCYDIFHLKCLNEIANQLPETTAPAGYECPTCKKPIIPYANQAGPLVECVNNKIKKSSWFQRTLGIKSSSEEMEADNFEFIEKSQSEQEQKLLDHQSKENYSANRANMKSLQPIAANATRLNQKPTNHDQTDDHKTHSVYQMPDVEQSPNIRKGFTSNRVQDVRTDPVNSNPKTIDDDNKYSRKSLLTHISTLMKAYFPLSTSRRSPQTAYRYFIFTLILGIILFIILLWLFSILGRYSAEQDPMLDPRYNPNLEFAKDQQLVRPIKDDKDGMIVRGAVNNIEAPSRG